MKSKKLLTALIIAVFSLTCLPLGSFVEANNGDLPFLLVDLVLKEYHKAEV